MRTGQGRVDECSAGGCGVEDVLTEVRIVGSRAASVWIERFSDGIDKSPVSACSRSCSGAGKGRRRTTRTRVRRRATRAGAGEGAAAPSTTRSSTSTKTSLCIKKMPKKSNTKNLIPHPPTHSEMAGVGRKTESSGMLSGGEPTAWLLSWQRRSRAAFHTKKEQDKKESSVQFSEWRILKYRVWSELMTLKIPSFRRQRCDLYALVKSVC